jgi:hypothetical protein
MIDQPFEQVTWPHQLLPLLAAVAWDISAFFNFSGFFLLISPEPGL